MLCNICNSSVTLLGVATVLQKFQVHYFRCDNCAFVQTEKPFWLSEAYSETIARSDIGLVGRNIKLSYITAMIISIFFKSKSRFLDYGGGNGMFVRLMRDKGFDYFWQDRYTSNQFSRGFEGIDGIKYNLVTAFEVFEHLEDPISEIEQMFAYSENILFSTTLLPVSPPNLGDWWYFTLDTGQHISFYSKQSLSVIAKKFNLKLYSNGKSIHLLTKKKIPELLFNLLSIGRFASFFWIFFSIGKISLLENDYFKLTNKKLR